MIYDLGLEPGARLPSERQFAEALGVSRPTVRDAFTELREEGIVVVRQGSGAYLAEDPVAVVDPKLSREHVAMILDALELRAAVEGRAASLAAARASPAQVEAIADANARMAKAIEAGRDSVEPDLAFHCAVAEATNNSAFVRTIRLLGRQAIPRAVAASNGQKDQAAPNSEYLRSIEGEHRAVLDAIRQGDGDSAERSMTNHLTRSRQRYARLQEGRE